jgi:hypothetical protein
MRVGEGEEIALGLLVLSAVQLLHRSGPGVIGVEGAQKRRIHLQPLQRLVVGFLQGNRVGQGRRFRNRVRPHASLRSSAHLDGLELWTRLGFLDSRRRCLARGFLLGGLGRKRRELHFQLLDAAVLLRDQRRLCPELAAQFLELLRLVRRPRRRAGARDRKQHQRDGWTQRRRRSGNGGLR